MHLHVDARTRAQTETHANTAKRKMRVFCAWAKKTSRHVHVQTFLVQGLSGHTIVVANSPYTSKVGHVGVLRLQYTSTRKAVNHPV